MVPILGPEARASIERDIEQARAARVALQSKLDSAVARFERAESDLAQTEAKVAAIGVKLSEAESRLQSVKHRLGKRANATYRQGAAAWVEVLMSSGGLSDLSRRLVLLERAAGSETAILIEAARTKALVGDLQKDLLSRKLEQGRLAKSLRALTGELADRFSEAARLEEKLRADRESELRRQREVAARAARAAAAARRVTSSRFTSSEFRCPIDGATSFRDSWGEPRSGGRRHQGVDMYAAHGTPAAAVVSGSILRMSRSSLGGISLYLKGADGSEFYYAHLAGYARISQGQQVSAGQHIAYVGNSGNASGGPAHLHFEIHPGGGSPINPYPAVKAACG